MIVHNLKNITLMKYVLKNFSCSAVLFILITPVYVVSSSICQITPTQIIKVNEVRDGSDNLKIYATVGAITANPAAWVQTIISDGLSATNNFAPVLISNALGDIVVIWVYIDSFGICQTATSILLHGATTWYSSTISQEGWDARARYYDGSIDESGNAIVHWIGVSITDGSLTTLAATASLSTNTVWSDQFVLGS